MMVALINIQAHKGSGDDVCHKPSQQPIRLVFQFMPCWCQLSLTCRSREPLIQSSLKQQPNKTPPSCFSAWSGEVSLKEHHQAVMPQTLQSRQGMIHQSIQGRPNSRKPTKDTPRPSMRKPWQPTMKPAPFDPKTLRRRPIAVRLEKFGELPGPTPHNRRLFVNDTSILSVWIDIFCARFRYRSCDNAI